MEIEQKHFDAMMNGQKCKFWGNCDDGRRYISTIGSISKISTKHFADIRDVYWQNCEPIKTVRYLKEPVKMMKTLIEGGWKQGSNGFIIHSSPVTFLYKMFYDCGKPEYEWSENWEVCPSWIEEREE